MEFQCIVASASNEAAAHRRARPRRKLRDETLTQLKGNVVDFIDICRSQFRRVLIAFVVSRNTRVMFNDARALAPRTTRIETRA